MSEELDVPGPGLFQRTSAFNPAPGIRAAAAHLENTAKGEPEKEDLPLPRLRIRELVNLIRDELAPLSGFEDYDRIYDYLDELEGIVRA